jgi:hypothetical protein
MTRRLTHSEILARSSPTYPSPYAEQKAREHDATAKARADQRFPRNVPPASFQAGRPLAGERGMECRKSTPFGICNLVAGHGGPCLDTTQERASEAPDER